MCANEFDGRMTPRSGRLQRGSVQLLGRKAPRPRRRCPVRHRQHELTVGVPAEEAECAKEGGHGIELVRWRLREVLLRNGAMVAAHDRTRNAALRQGEAPVVCARARAPPRRARTLTPSRMSLYRDMVSLFLMTRFLAASLAISATALLDQHRLQEGDIGTSVRG